ncbi:MAG TPA: aminotransferase class V-fold PLP-dependent enzyme [Pilimelia sp.]|nr:aminotransferase class V-fold PLP-dependent enzyme [Pilimelia sp.]
MTDAAVTPPDPLPGARLLFSLDPAVAHLNHGSFGAAPIGVQRAQQRLRDEAEANPMRYHTRGLEERVAHTRRHIARFLGADLERSALVPNTTTGVAVVLNSLRLDAGGEILLTDHGYGAVALAVEREHRRTGVGVRTVRVPLGASDDEVVAATLDGIRPRTRLVIIDQLTSPTAQLMPVAAVCAAAREHGVPVLVDAAHVPGMLPVDVSAIGADFWVGNLHKWAYAARGTAVLCVSPRWSDRIEPLAVSWAQPEGFPASVEFQGTKDVSAWLAAPVGLFTLHTLGLDAVRRHNAALVAYGQWTIGTALGLKPDELPEPGGLDGGRNAVSMRIVPLPSGVAATVPDAIALRGLISDRLGAEVAISAWRDRGYLRISGQVYNRPEEYDRLAVRLPRLLAELG